MNILDNNIHIKLDTRKLNYIKYFLYLYIDNNPQIIGKIVLECYNNVWNLELMDISYPYQRKGYGTLFLCKVLTLENLDAKYMTVCPSNEDSARFYKRNGFEVPDLMIYDKC